jgi:hypothetical protein
MMKARRVGNEQVEEAMTGGRTKGAQRGGSGGEDQVRESGQGGSMGWAGAGGRQGQSGRIREVEFRLCSSMGLDILVRSNLKTKKLFGDGGSSPGVSNLSFAKNLKQTKQT